MFRRLLTALALLLAASAATASPLAEQMKEVEKLRGRKFVHDVAHVTIDRSELDSRLTDQMQKSLSYPIADYATVLRALQLVDGTGDVLAPMLKLYDAQVIAYYDPITHVYTSVRQPPPSLAGIDAATLEDVVAVHELTHALQDQIFDAGKRDQALQRDTDANLAYHALLEGEASLVMLAALGDKMGQKLDDVVKNDMLVSALGSAAVADQSIPEGTPKYFVEELKLPYIQGLQLVIDGYRRGGWNEIDRMHADPPRSTRELLHDSEYFDRIGSPHPQAPAAFDAKPPLTMKHVITVEHLGEFHWRFLVGDKSAAGWLDDRVTVAENDDCQPTVLVETKWENADRAKAFRDAYDAFLRGRKVTPAIAQNGAVVKVAYGADTAAIHAFLR